LVAEMAVLRLRAGGARRPAVVLLAAALGVTAITGSLAGDVLAAALVAGVGAWLVAASIGRADVEFGHAVRVVGLFGVLAVPQDPGGAAVVGGVLLGLLAIDALRLRDPRVVYGAVVVVPYGLIGLLVARGISQPFAGVGVCLAGVVVAGLAAVVDDERWQQPIAVVALALEVLGVAVAADDPRAIGDALLLAGAVVLAGGVLLRRNEVLHLGAGTLTLGIWSHLASSGVTISEFYVLPVAAHLLVAGIVARRRHEVSSWVAYAPPVAVVGGVAIAERLAGGAAGHALVAGLVGVTAVVVGGHRRLAAPLVLGTVLCVVVAGYEALAVTATVPTWGWLALAGSILLAAGVTIERTGASPVDAGRRLADVVVNQFS
jgi:hypothetical protein